MATEFEAMADDAAPGEWLVLDISGALPDPAAPATVARFYPPHAESRARQYARFREAEATDPLDGPTALPTPPLGGLWRALFGRRNLGRA